MLPLLIYIHGFNSSPLSEKATEVRSYILNHGISVDYQVPALSDYPDECCRQLETLMERNADRKVAMIGSSMGGFWATVLAEKYEIKAVLVNPAVRPSELIGTVLGDNENPYTGNRYYLDQSHVDLLSALEPERPRAPENFLLMVQAGDETLDYRRAVDYYRGCEQVVEAGGDHRFQGFVGHLPAIFKFLDLD